MLGEMVRLLADEVNYANGSTGSNAAAACDWTTSITQSVTLGKAQLIAVRFTIHNVAGAAPAVHARVLINGVCVWASAEQHVYSDQTYSFVTAAPAGTYNVLIQLSDPETDAARSTWQVTSAYIGKCNFSDLATYSQDITDSINNNATKTVLTQTVTVPAARPTPLGNTYHHLVIVWVYMQADANRVGSVRNSGDADVAGRMNWRLYKDGVESGWYSGASDRSTCGDSLTYAAGSCGMFMDKFIPGQSITFRVDGYNDGLGSAQPVTVSMRVLICPWILGPWTDVYPVTLAGSQYSTAYVKLEPLDQNPTKYCNIGKIRAVTFGAATDYYYTVSGTNILDGSYTFESIEMNTAILFTYGFGGCISYIGVDPR